MKSVAVLMSTYNGSKYISQQISSILSQTYENITLYIRDDGSTDNTLEIVKKIQKENGSSKKIILIEDTCGNLGYGDSFVKLIQTVNGFDYYAFCDQDDYWLDNKIIRAVEYLDGGDQDKCCLYASNYWICNDKLRSKNTYSDNIDLFDYSLGHLFMEGKVSGFTLVFNNKLRETAFIKSTIQHIGVHDKWLSVAINGLNQVFIYDKEPTAYYRRHEAAASSTDQTQIQRIKWRFKNIVKKGYLQKTLSMIKTYKNSFYNHIFNSQDKEFLDIFTDGGGLGRFQRTFYPHRLRDKFLDEVFLRLLFLIVSN